MKIVVFAASKGGTGKTSLAFAAAIEAAAHGTVFLADMDPQRSLTAICETRGQNQDNPEDNPLLLEDVESVGGAAARLVRAGYERDFLIVDTPGSFMRVIEDAITAADCVVLPVQASPLDVRAQKDVAEIVRKQGKAERTLFVLNRCDGRTNVEDTIEGLAPLSPSRIVRINQRADYARALVTGKSAAEINRACAAEIDALWKAISAILEKDNSHEKV